VKAENIFISIFSSHSNTWDLAISEITVIISYLYVKILSGILVTRHQHIFSFLSVYVCYLNAEQSEASSVCKYSAS
jgi:hypothetical protein